MAFEKGNKLSKGRKVGSRNKANILTEAFDQVYEKDLGSGEGIAMFLEKNIVHLMGKVNRNELSIDQQINLMKSLAPYYASKNTSTISEITKTDNTVSGKMVREVNEARMKIQKLESELKEAKRKKLRPLSELA